MKRIIYTILLLFLGISMSFAQVQKGDSNIGATVTLSSTTGQENAAGESENTTNLFLFVNYELFITNSLSLGAGPSLFVSGTAGTTTTGLGFNIFANYNFLTSGGVVLPYAGTLLNIQNFNTSGDAFDSSTRNIGMGIKGGMKIFLSERINLDTNLGYSTTISTTTKFNGTEVDTGSPKGGQIQLFVGLGIILGKRGS